MAKRCNRSGCGHREEDHLKPEHGGCFGRQPGTGHRCLCTAFVEAEAEQEPARPPSVRPALAVVGETAAEALSRLEANGLRIPEHAQPLREATAVELDTHAKRRTFDPGRLVGAERNAPAVLDPERIKGHTLIESGMKISLAGKGREMTELHAAANAIVAETNAEDLATGVHEMRQKIRTQATALAEARAELEAKEKQLLEQGSFQNAIALVLGVPYTTARQTVLLLAADAIKFAREKKDPKDASKSMSIHINVTGGDPDRIAAKLAEAFKPTPA